MNNKFRDFIPYKYLFCVPSLYLALGLSFGIILGTKYKIFTAEPNALITTVIIVSLLLTNRYSKTLSLIISIFIGLLLQNSWEKSIETGENLFPQNGAVLISAEFYSPPKYRSEKRMEQLVSLRKSDYRINLILKDTLTDYILESGQNAEILGIFRKYDNQNTAAPWEYDNIFQEKIKNSIGEIEVISIKKQTKMPHITAIYRHIRKNFAKTQYESLYISIFTGDRSFLTQNINSFFRESGLVHFLAISGLHIAILIFAFSAIIFILPLPILVRRCIVVCAILFLPFIVGFGPATLRAVIMGTIMLISPLFDRKSNALNSLFLSCFFILSLYPMHIFLVGFQYSFTATFAVLVFPKFIRDVKFREIILFFTLPIFLFVVITPIQIFHFGALTSATPLANLILLPILQAICQIALISLFIPIESISNFLCMMTDKALDLLFWIINKYVIFTGLGEDYANISPLIFIVIIVIVIILYTFSRNRIIYLTYAVLFMLSGLLISDLCKKDTIYTVSSQNFRMKLLDSNNPVLVILGAAQTKNYYNPSFLRWTKTHLGSRFFSVKSKPVLISDNSYIPQKLSENFTHIILRNTTGKVYFDTYADTIKTTPFSAEETKIRKINIVKKYDKTRI
ncbi:MAG: ComEC/Rec2 family competence protein [Chitinispirillales bacterium]|jgi:ComEC/Rec2-related protein|nr:ComEC/Rec2 family competence protein [Chitinispirillales bacterium]